jgi:RNA polymerase sigma-70 factor, ECF subfamily
VNEAELDGRMARLAAGERAEFTPVYRELLPRARRVALRVVADDVADDVAQQVLLAVFERASEFTPGRPCLPWFYAIVANQLRTVSRREHRAAIRSASVERASALAADDQPESLLAERELRRALAVAIQSLDATSADAIAALLGDERPPIPPATFRKRLSRAYSRLRALLAGPGGFDV